jgi:hypothetical protein
MLVADEVARAVLAAGETGADGGWATEIPAGAPEELLLFGRCRGEALGVVYARVRRGSPPLDLEMTAVAPTHELTVVIEGVPDTLRPQIRLTPRRIGSLDRTILRWVHAPVDQARSSALAGFTPDERLLRRWVQAGTWWLTAQLLFESSGQISGQPLPDSWLPVAARTGNGLELTPVRDGFEFEVNGPVTVTVRLAPRPTETLNR